MKEKVIMKSRRMKFKRKSAGHEKLRNSATAWLMMFVVRNKKWPMSDDDDE